MPDDRLFHKRLGHSDKVNLLTSDEEIVWRTYIQAADDFGVMRFSIEPLRDAHDRLQKVRPKSLAKMLERIKTVDLVRVFEHQGRTYCYQYDWQDWQKIRYALTTIHPRIPAAILATCSLPTQWLHTLWPGGGGRERKLSNWLPAKTWTPPDWAARSGNGSGNGSNPSQARRPDRPCPVPVQIPIPVITPDVESGGEEVVVPKSRSVAAPPRALDEPSTLPTLSSAEPAKDGNYAVIVRIAHEALDELSCEEPTGEVCARVKELCAERRIDYGRHPDVSVDVVRKAVESAAAQRALLPVRPSGAGAPTSLGSLAQDFRARLEAIRSRAREA